MVPDDYLQCTMDSSNNSITTTTATPTNKTNTTNTYNNTTTTTTTLSSTTTTSSSDNSADINNTSGTTTTTKPSNISSDNTNPPTTTTPTDTPNNNASNGGGSAEQQLKSVNSTTNTAAGTTGTASVASKPSTTTSVSSVGSESSKLVNSGESTVLLEVAASSVRAPSTAPASGTTASGATLGGGAAATTTTTTNIMKDPMRSTAQHNAPPDSGASAEGNSFIGNLTRNNNSAKLENALVSGTNEASGAGTQNTNVVLRIPLTRQTDTSNSAADLYPNLSKCVLVQNGPDNLSSETNDVNSSKENISNSSNNANSFIDSNSIIDTNNKREEPGESGKNVNSSETPSRRASYIDVVGLSSDDLQSPSDLNASSNGTILNALVSTTALATSLTDPLTPAANNADEQQQQQRQVSASVVAATDGIKITNLSGTENDSSRSGGVQVPKTAAATVSSSKSSSSHTAPAFAPGITSKGFITASARALATAAAEDSEDKEFSEDEDKLVIHEGCNTDKRIDEEDVLLQVTTTAGSTKRTAEDDASDETPKKKSRHENSTKPSNSNTTTVASTNNNNSTSATGVADVINLSTTTISNSSSSGVIISKVEIKESKEGFSSGFPPSLDSLSTAAQVDVMLLQVNRDVQVLQKQLREKEEEWNGVLRSLKEKEELSARLKRKMAVLRYQAGDAADLSVLGDIRKLDSAAVVRDLHSAGGNLMAALTAGGASAAQSAYESNNPLAMMSRLLSSSIIQQNSNNASLCQTSNTNDNNSRSNASSPSVSIIDIHTRTSSPIINISSQDPTSSSNLASLSTSHNINRYNNSSSSNIATINLPDNLKNKLTRQLLSNNSSSNSVGGNVGSNMLGNIKAILPKPQSGLAGNNNNVNNGAALLSSIAGQSPAPQTLASMLSAGPNGPINSHPGNKDCAVVSSAALLATHGTLQATGYGPQGPTISVQQLIAAHRKDNPATPPVRGAKRGAWRQKYDTGSCKRGGRSDMAAAAVAAASNAGIALSDPNISYNDMLLQFAQLTQQHQHAAAAAAAAVVAADKNNPGSPQVSIIPVSDNSSSVAGSSVATASGSQFTSIPCNSPLTLGGGLSVTPTLSSKHNNSNNSPMLEGTSALAKLLMESRGGNKQNSLLEQQQQLHQQSGAGGGVSNSQYLTLSALLSGGSTTTVREKAAAAAAMVTAHHNSDGRIKKVGDSNTIIDASGGGAGNPKCQGCHKVRAQFVCAGCGNQWYCSRECQVAAWDEHSERCNT